MIDIETSSLSGIESGRFYPSLHVLEKIAHVFDVELIEFFKFSTVNLPENLFLGSIAIIIIIAIVIVGIIIISSNSSPGYEMDVKNKEALAYTRLRQAIANSRLNGSGTLSSEDYNILGKMVKNAVFNALLYNKFI